MPLIFILDEFRERNYVVDWCDFIDYCLEKQWNIEQTLTRIEESLIEHKDEKEHVLKFIKYYLIIKMENVP